MFTRYRKRTIVGITVQMFAQLNGINIISFYLPSTLASAGFDERKSLLYTAANALPYTAATITTWWLADKWGRKPLLILGGQLPPTFTFTTIPSLFSLLPLPYLEPIISTWKANMKTYRCRNGNPPLNSLRLPRSKFRNRHESQWSIRLCDAVQHHVWLYLGPYAMAFARRDLPTSRKKQGHGFSNNKVSSTYTTPI